MQDPEDKAAVMVIPITGIPVVDEGDEISRLICDAAEKQKTPIKDGDILVVTHVVVSRAEGSVVDLGSVTPSEFAENIASDSDKDPALVEVILREADKIIRMKRKSLITQTKHGFICANSGVDKSNVPGERFVALLPRNPDKSAWQIRSEIQAYIGKKVAVIVSDTHGRPLRDGEINIAIGASGLSPIRDRRGEEDLFGYRLKVKRTAVADELASAAELVMGQANEGVAAAIIRGYSFEESEEGGAKNMLRPIEDELFV